MESLVKLLINGLIAGRLTRHEADRLYAHLIRVLLVITGIMMMSLTCMFMGWESIAFALLLILVLATAVFWFQPSQLFLVSLTGAIAGSIETGTADGARSGAVKFLKGYVSLLRKLLFGGTLALWLLFLTVRAHLMVPSSWFDSPPSFEGLSIWGWQRWFWMLVFAGALTYVIGRYKGRDAGKKAGRIIFGIVAFTLVGTVILDAPPVRWLGSVLLGTPTFVSVTPSEAQVPLAQGPESHWAKGVMGPYGKSMRIPEFKLTRAWVSGAGFRILCYYQNGARQTSPYPDHCPDKQDIYEMVLLNTTGHNNEFGYGYKL